MALIFCAIIAQSLHNVAAGNAFEVWRWEVARPTYDFEGLCLLWSAVFRMAYRDARQGCAEAVNYLDFVVGSDWRHFDQRRQQQQQQRAKRPYKQRQRLNENHSQVKGKGRRGAMGQQHGSVGQQHGSMGRGTV